jgi:hypothetical protein
MKWKERFRPRIIIQHVQRCVLFYCRLNRRFLLILGGADNEGSDIIASGIVVLGVRSVTSGESARQPASAINALLAGLENFQQK